MASSAPTKLAAMLSTWTDGSDGPLLEALFGSLTANAADSRETKEYVALAVTPPTRHKRRTCAARLPMRRKVVPAIP